MDLANNKRTWGYLAIAVLLMLLLLRTCSTEITTDDSEGTTITTVQDSIVYIPGRADTIYIPGSTVYIKNIQPSEEVKKAGDTSIYKTEIQDSILTGTIVSKVKGVLINTDFTYTPKFIQQILRVDTIIDYKTTLIEKTTILNRLEVSVGAQLGAGPTSVVFQPSILIRTPKNLSVLGGYDLINNTYNIGVFQRIPWFDKKK